MERTQTTDNIMLAMVILLCLTFMPVAYFVYVVWQLPPQVLGLYIPFALAGKVYYYAFIDPPNDRGE